MSGPGRSLSAIDGSCPVSSVSGTGNRQMGGTGPFLSQILRDSGPNGQGRSALFAPAFPPSEEYRRLSPTRCWPVPNAE
ncbi:hypothetical protein GCM10010251_81000 [Streptomyces aurantiogriseus]|uniref:Uncharacterized protein n=1 Tax=Streptomyces aurantiogriseus TaxID=66870 RepID=A0A918FLK0_9ACTN|nr:hypothetical protein GCM10010251_81000 [Streptomyces aurantiogriseus]